jgi:MOSC domain-containing protein YiiM
VVTVAQLHVAPGSRLPMRSVGSVEIETARGIIGDRYHGSRHRQVSVQSLSALAEAGQLFGSEIPAGLTRRNITLSSGPVPRDPGALIRLGPVLLEVVRVAAPCKLLDDTIGRGAQEALRRRGGSICRVLVGGRVRVGDPVELPAVGEPHDGVDHRGSTDDHAEDDQQALGTAHGSSLAPPPHQTNGLYGSVHEGAR